MSPKAKRPRTAEERDVFLENAQNFLGRVNLVSLGRTLHDANVQISVKTLKKANLHLYSKIACSDQLPLQDGSTFTWEYTEPALLLGELVARPPAYAKMVSDALARYPCSESQRWHLVLAFDEYVPGDRYSLEIHVRS